MHNRLCRLRRGAVARKHVHTHAHIRNKLPPHHVSSIHYTHVIICNTQSWFGWFEETCALRARIPFLCARTINWLNKYKIKIVHAHNTRKIRTPFMCHCWCREDATTRSEFAERARAFPCCGEKRIARTSRRPIPSIRTFLFDSW